MVANREFLFTLENDRLKELVRRDLSLEILGVPNLFDKVRKSLGDKRLEIKDILVHSVIKQNNLIPELGHSAQSLDDHIHIVIHFNIIQTHKARLVIYAVKCS